MDYTVSFGGVRNGYATATKALKRYDTLISLGILPGSLYLLRGSRTITHDELKAAAKQEQEDQAKAKESSDAKLAEQAALADLPKAARVA